MHAYKQRPDESYVPQRRPAAVAVAIDGNGEPFAAHPSPARAMHDDLVERLKTGRGEARNTGLSIRAKFAVIGGMAVVAWLPIAAVGLLFID